MFDFGLEWYHIAFMGGVLAILLILVWLVFFAPSSYGGNIGGVYNPFK